MNFPAFYGTRRSINLFTRALHWSLSWATSIQSTPSHSISPRQTLILFTHLRLGLPSGLFLSGFHTNILHAFHLSPIRATRPVQLILLDLTFYNAHGIRTEILITLINILQAFYGTRGNSWCFQQEPLNLSLGVTFHNMLLCTVRNCWPISKPRNHRVAPCAVSVASFF
jgi:hypothetical protein